MDGRDRDGSRGLHAVHELRWRTIGARWRRLQTPDRTAGRLQTTQTCYSQLEEKLCFVTSFFVFWRCRIFARLRRRSPAGGFPRLPGFKRGAGRWNDRESRACRWQLGCHRWRCLFAVRDLFELQFFLSGYTEMWLLFVIQMICRSIMGKMPNDIKPFWNHVESTDMKWRTWINCRRLRF